MISENHRPRVQENAVRVGQRIRELREERGWDQIEMARYLERSQACVSRWEVGSRSPDIDGLIDLARLFGVHVGAIVEVPARQGSQSRTRARPRRRPRKA